MKIPRISIHALMSVVLLIALDCMVIRALMVRNDYAVNRIRMLLLACAPMAHILAVVAAILARGPVRARPFLLGFEVGGWIAVLAVSFLHVRILYFVEVALMSSRVGSWLMSLPEWVMEIAGLAIVIGLFLLIQLVAAIICGWIARRWLAVPSADSPSRRRLVPPLVAVLMLAVPALSVVGYLRWVVDAQQLRRPVGFEAVVDLTRTMGTPASVSTSSRFSPLIGAKVKVDRDVEPCVIELVALSNAPEHDVHVNDYRIVHVTILDGDRAGESMEIPHCFLRPSTEPAPSIAATNASRLPPPPPPPPLEQ